MYFVKETDFYLKISYIYKVSYVLYIFLLKMERNVKMKIEVEENVVITQDSMSNLEKDEEKKLTVDNQDNLHENHKYA